MPHTQKNFSPADPAALEISTYSFDFGPALGVGETLLSSEWTLQVHAGTDPSPSSHLLGVSQISGTVTMQKIGNLVSGVTYTALATVTTNAGQTLTLYAQIYCMPVT